MLMDSRKSELLEKYWAAEASIGEEQELRGLIKNSQEEEDEELKSLFTHFDEEAKPTLDASFDEEILSLISEEKETKVVSFSEYFKRYASIAAAIMVMAVCGFLFTQQQQQYQSEDTFETPEEAYAEFKKQMLMVSNYMNKGNTAIEGFSTLGIADKSLEGLSVLSTASEGLELLEEMNLENN